MRSYLYVPADSPRKLAKALTGDADAIVADLEDAVHPDAKDGARVELRTWLAESDVEKPVWVRVNPGESRAVDLRAVVGPTITGVLLAKTEQRAEVDEVDALLTELERERGLESGSVGVVPLLESAGAVLRAAEIGAGPRVRRLQLGEADLRADLGVRPGVDERELLWVRSQLVAVSAALGLTPPVASVRPDYRDLAALRTSTEALAALGFRGRSCIHPAQLAVVNEVFTPTPEAIEHAREVLARYAEVQRDGGGVFGTPDGSMVDEAVVRQARGVLSSIPRETLVTELGSNS